jgi:hypothetical protein
MVVAAGRTSATADYRASRRGTAAYKAPKTWWIANAPGQIIPSSKAMSTALVSARIERVKRAGDALSAGRRVAWVARLELVSMRPVIQLGARSRL